MRSVGIKMECGDIGREWGSHESGVMNEKCGDKDVLWVYR